MPELPEVETVKRILEQEVIGKTIEDIEFYRAKNVVTGAEEFVRTLKGKKIEAMSRVGKFLVFHLSEGHVIVSHLRMEGKYYAGMKDDPVEKHEILRFLFTDGTRLSYLDTRKFGVLYLEREDDYLAKAPLTEVGTEPWSTDPSALLKAYRRKKGPLKEALLDQGIMCGLGNIYADEVLFATSLHPLKACPTLKEEDAEAIVKESSRILKMAIDNGGSTIRSYHPKEGMDGRMQNVLEAYGRVGKPCSKCGLPLKKIRVGGRGTTYCPHCQRDADHPFVVALTGPIASGKSAVGAYLAEHGFARIDLDEIVSRLYEEKEVLSKLQEILGSEAVKDGKLDRAYVLEEITSDPSLKKRLEEYVHPLAYEKAIEEEKGHDKILYEVPFYLGSPIEERTDALIYIEADTAIRAKRIEERGKNPALAIKMNENYPWEEVKKKATLTLRGDGTLEELHRILSSVKYLN